MKRFATALLLSLVPFAGMAFDTPQVDIEQQEERAPRGEVLMYDGERYVKRYKYIMHLNGYAATIQRETDAARIDSIYRVITREANYRLAIEGRKYVSAAGHIKNMSKVKAIARRVLGKRWIEELTRKGENVRINIVANAEDEVLYLDISYIGEDSLLDEKMITLQERLHKRVRFGIGGAKDGILSNKPPLETTRKSDKRYAYYYMFWVTNLYKDKTNNELYLSRGVSIIN